MIAIVKSFSGNAVQQLFPVPSDESVYQSLITVGNLDELGGSYNVTTLLKKLMQVQLR